MYLVLGVHYNILKGSVEIPDEFSSTSSYFQKWPRFLSYLRNNITLITKNVGLIIITTGQGYIMTY